MKLTLRQKKVEAKYNSYVARVNADAKAIGEGLRSEEGAVKPSAKSSTKNRLAADSYIKKLLHVALFTKSARKHGGFVSADLNESSVSLAHRRKLYAAARRLAEKAYKLGARYVPVRKIKRGDRIAPQGYYGRESDIVVVRYAPKRDKYGFTKLQLGPSFTMVTDADVLRFPRKRK